MSVACHPLNVADHVVQGRVVSEDEILVHGKGEAFANFGHDFGLLDRVNAEFALEVLVEFNEIGRVPRMADNHFNHRRGHGLITHHGGLRRWWNGCLLDRCFWLDRRFNWFWSWLDHGRFSFPCLRGRPWFTLHTTVQVVVPVDVGHEFVLQNSHHNVFRTGKISCPRKEFGTVNALTLNGPTAHQGQCDL